MGLARQRGVTLVELVIVIVIVGIAAAALYGAMAAIGGRSADPLLRQQSLAIAEAYLEEIGLQAFPPGTSCPASHDGSGRGSFDDICDYNGLTYGGATPLAPRSALSAVPIAGLEAYQVAVQVSGSALHDIASSDALRIRVRVTDPAGQTLELSGYRARY